MKKLISYVFPIYNEEGNIELLFETMTKVVNKIKDKYDVEYIFINDGSKDKSLELLLDLVKKNKNVKVIDFARNFGHQLAVTAGLDHTKGDAVIIMDSDMQDPPEVSLELIKKWEEGFDVVYAQRRTREDTFLKKFTSMLFYRVLDKLADIRIPKDTGDFRLIDRKVVDTLNSFREHNRYLRGMVSYIGFKQTPLLFDRHGRHAGKTGYPIKALFKLASDGIFSFSFFPLRLVGIVSAIFVSISFLIFLLILINNIFTLNIFGPESNWFLYAFLLLLSGINLFCLSMFGEYLGRIYSEVQNRPLYIINKVY